MSITPNVTVRSATAGQCLLSVARLVGCALHAAYARVMLHDWQIAGASADA